MSAFHQLSRTGRQGSKENINVTRDKALTVIFDGHFVTYIHLLSDSDDEDSEDSVGSDSEPEETEEGENRFAYPEFDQK